MSRLPISGHDSGTWGDILNDYLLQAHKADGALKDDSVTANVIAPNSITNAAIASNAINASNIADGTITEALLDSGVQAKLNTATPTWTTLAGKPAVFAAGSTSAAARNAVAAQRKVSFTPFDFDPNFTENPANTFDCTPGIQAALDACRDLPGGEVVLPVGYLKVTGLTIYNNTILRGKGDYTSLVLTGGSNRNLIQSASYGHATNDDRGIIIRDIRMICNKANNTVVVGQAQLTANLTLGTDTTLNVTNTDGFANSGVLWVGWASVAYTGKTATTFTGCSPTSETGNVAQGAWVNPVAGQGHAIALQAHRCRLTNLTIQDARGSGIYVQGPYDGQYQAENIFENIKSEYNLRFGVEIGENASDGMMSKIIPGGCLMGGLHMRGGNWTVMDTHPVGNFATYDQLGPAFHIASNETRILNTMTDTWPSTSVIIDGFVRGVGPSETQLSNLRLFQANYGGGSAVTIKAPSSRTVARTQLSDCNFTAPYDWAISSGPTTNLVGAQNLASPTDGKVQVRCAGDFGVTSAAEGTLNVAGDSLSYTGRQMSGSFARNSIALGDTSITVDSTAGFDSSGTLVLTMAISAGSVYRVQYVTYTGKTSTTFTGIPASGPGSILYAGSGWPNVATQHFFTGVTGGANVAAAAGATVECTAAQPVISEMGVTSTIFRGYQKGPHRVLGSSDTFQILGGFQSGRASGGMVPYRSLSVDTALETSDYLLEFTGGTARTFTLPTPSTGRGSEYVFKNRSSANLTITGPSANVIYDDAVVTSFVIPPGGSSRVISSATYWLRVGSNAAWSRVLLSGAATLEASLGSRYIVLMTSGAVPTLPTAVGNNSLYVLVNNTTATILVLTTSSQTIDGLASWSVPAGASVELVSDGSNWALAIPAVSTPDEVASGESTMSRRNVVVATVATGNGNLRLSYFTAKKTETITQVRSLCGGTASSGATLQRIGVYEVDSSGNLNLVASTASDTAMWTSGSTAYTKSLSVSFSKKRGQRYAIGIIVTGTSTAPTLYGHNGLLSSEAGISPRVGGLVGSQTDLPASISAGAIGDQAHLAYVALVP